MYGKLMVMLGKKYASEKLGVNFKNPRTFMEADGDCCPKSILKALSESKPFSHSGSNLTQQVQNLRNQSISSAQTSLQRV